jgi:hypothetical protein
MTAPWHPDARRGARRERIRDEHARSHDALRQFDQAHPAFLQHPVVLLVGHQLLSDAQRLDLANAGLLPAGHVSDAQVNDLHLRARAGGHPVRSAGQLIEHAASECERRLPELKRGGRR